VSLLVPTRKRASNNHRGRLDIIADILDASCGGVKKTFLMYRCNLSFKQLKYYLGFMIKNEFLQQTTVNGYSNRSLFKVTDKGKEFMKAYQGLEDLMK
jgi:predicted transcriptional regulator